MAMRIALRTRGFVQQQVSFTTTRLAAAKLPSASELAVELRTMKEHSDVAKAHLGARGSEMVDDVDRLAGLWDQLVVKKRERDAALSKRKSTSVEIGKLMKTGTEEEIAALKALVAEVGETAQALERDIEAAEAEAELLIAKMPNFLDDETPRGASENDNVVVKTWRPDSRKIGEEFQWHDDLAVGYDPDAAARVSGARFSVLRGDLARLERGLTNFFLDKAIENGYEETSVPLIVSRRALEGTGQLPKFEDDLFRIANHQVRGEDAFLIPTAEVPLTNLMAGELMEEGDLPMKLAAATPCFRAEAGSYGRDTRGLIRQHQFLKVELVKITTPETATAEHLAMVRDAETLLELLELPYRTVALCSGDLGFSARRCFDLEVWLPGQQAYREISSISVCHDFQARRMGLRYRPKPDEKKKKQKPRNPFTINGSGLAVGRTLVAILENGQQPDGTIQLPAVLEPYMGGITSLSSTTSSSK